MYDKKFKPGKDGLFTRYIGQKQNGVPEKFRLGYEPEAAEQKVQLIAALWKGIEDYTPKAFKPFWDPKSLEAAKAIAKGEAPRLPKRDFEDPIKYVRRVSQISKITATPFEPQDPAGYQVGLDDIRHEITLA